MSLFYVFLRAYNVHVCNDMYSYACFCVFVCVRACMCLCAHVCVCVYVFLYPSEKCSNVRLLFWCEKNSWKGIMWMVVQANEILLLLLLLLLFCVWLSVYMHWIFIMSAWAREKKRRIMRIVFSKLVCF